MSEDGVVYSAFCLDIFRKFWRDTIASEIHVSLCTRATGRPRPRSCDKRYGPHMGKLCNISIDGLNRNITLRRATKRRVN